MTRDLFLFFHPGMRKIIFFTLDTCSQDRNKLSSEKTAMKIFFRERAFPKKFVFFVSDKNKIFRYKIRSFAMSKLLLE
jgi:hypothetical protein